MYESLKQQILAAKDDFFTWLNDQHFLIQIFIKSVVSALIGSSFLSIFAEYSTYFYAIKIGVRPPFEGIPFLKSIVGITSFLAILVFNFFLYYFGNFISVVTEPSKNKHSISVIFLTKRQIYPLFTVFLLMTVGNLVYLYVLWPTGWNVEIILDQIAIFLVVILLTIITRYFILFRGVNINIYIALLSAGLCLYLIISTFTGVKYKSILKSSKFGGFAEVILIEILPDNKTKTHSCQLVLRSSTHITCHFPAYERFVEYPIENIQRISYKADLN